MKRYRPVGIFILGFLSGISLVMTVTVSPIFLWSLASSSSGAVILLWREILGYE